MIILLVYLDYDERTFVEVDDHFLSRKVYLMTTTHINILLLLIFLGRYVS